ncbi:LysR family transcriptional regulator [Vibrio rumoiensis]|uniref:LysR family transcriptional regulator n=1 Tax=Vibrio rumoiensis TaxID=76258 RepID=UPI003AA8E394
MDRLTCIKLFVAAVESGSLASAAKNLDISRSMATRLITALESSLQTRLLHRTTRNLGITNSGQALLPYCRTILEQEQMLYQEALMQQSEMNGKISVMTSISFGQLYLAGAIERFMEEYPNTEIDLRLTDREIDLVKEKVDIVIELNNQLPESLIGKKLGICSSVICATPEYLARYGSPQSVTELQDHNCLVHTKIGNNWNMVDKEKKKNFNIDVSSNFSVNDSSILLNAVLAGRGVACLPLPFVKNFLKDGLLDIILPKYDVNPVGIWGLYASRHFQPRIQRHLLSFLESDLYKS